MLTTILNSLDQGLITAFMALGVLITFQLMGFPDMTVEGTFMLGGTTAAALLASGVSPIVGTAVGVGIGCVGGMCTAVMHTKMGINPIIAGLLTTSAAFTTALLIMKRPNISLLQATTIYDDIIDAAGLPLSLWSRIGITAVFLTVTCAVLFWFLNTDLGIAIRAIGSNESMIRALAVNSDRVKLIAMSLSNGLVAGCGALAAQGQGFADVNMGTGALVAAFASLVVGQTLFRTRRLGLWIIAVGVGAVVYRGLLNLALRTGLPPDFFKLLTAVLVLIALYLPFAIGGWGTRRVFRMGRRSDSATERMPDEPMTGERMTGAGR
jgi:putative ABC transport system permease protein